MGGGDYIEVESDGEGDEVQFRSVGEQAAYVTWLPVTSTNVDSVAYEPKFDRLWVQFHSKKGGPRRYVYFGVPESLWRDLLASNSKGSWVDFVLKGNVGQGMRTDPYSFTGPF